MRTTDASVDAAVFEHSFDAILIVDVAANQIVAANPRACEILGFSRGDLEQAPLDAVHPDEPERLQQFLHTVQARGAGRADSFAWRARDGRSIPVELSASVIAQGARNQVLVVSRDLSQRQLEFSAIRESESQYRHLVETSHDLIWTTDSAGRITFANRVAAAAILDRHVEDMLGRRFDEFATPQAVPELARALHGVLHGVTVRDLDTAVRRGDGTTVFLNLNATPRHAENGQTIGMTGSATDVTSRVMGERERKGLEAQLRQAQKMEALGTLVGGIAHSFNNILLAIRGHTELVRDELSDDAPGHRSITQVLTATDRATDLVRQILAFSRQTDPALSPVAVDDIVAEAVRLLQATLPSTIAIHPPSRSIGGTIQADATQIHQILLNLGSNAAHAMREHGGDLTFTVRDLTIKTSRSETVGELQPGAYVAVEIRDTGLGIDRDILPRIFDPFFTTKEVGEGTGLGLSAVHGIVLSHHGAIRVESAPGTGTTFTLMFPRATRPARPEPTIVDRGVPGTERVLFVDDEKPIALLGEVMLGRLGYEVSVFTDSREALAAFSARPDAYDILVVDYTMPYLTGVDLARECRALRDDVPVVLTTGNADGVAQIASAADVITTMIPKPYNLRDLAHRLRGALGHAPTAAEGSSRT